jgi:hypothetical protein
MYIRLFIYPVLFFILSHYSAFLFGEWLPRNVPELLRPLADLGADSQHWIALILLAGGIILAINSLLRISRWHYGKEKTCKRCGCIADLRSGGYGSYRKCLGCGKRCQP